jgi:hypothetical protein
MCNERQMTIFPPSFMILIANGLFPRIIVINITTTISSSLSSLRLKLEIIEISFSVSDLDPFNFLYELSLK